MSRGRGCAARAQWPSGCRGGRTKPSREWTSRPGTAVQVLETKGRCRSARGSGTKSRRRTWCRPGWTNCLSAMARHASASASAGIPPSSCTSAPAPHPLPVVPRGGWCEASAHPRWSRARRWWLNRHVNSRHGPPTAGGCRAPRQVRWRGLRSYGHRQQTRRGRYGFVCPSEWPRLV